MLVGAVALLGLYVPAATAAAPKALINGDTVAGGVNSVEATIATELGFSVDVVDGPTWDAMTQAQFAQYQVLIAGDPDCGLIAASLIANEATWAPVVMGTAVNTAPGNRVLIGTDPVLHNDGIHQPVLIRDGIDFAGAQPGRTGFYFDTTCGGNYDGQEGVAASMMAQLSSGTGTWTEDDAPPCGGNVAKIASTPKFDSLTTADLEGWGCSVHESFPTFASDWSALAVATDTTSHPTCGTDTTVDPPVDACGEAYVLIAGSGIVVVAPNITVTPTNGSDPAGGSHTVTANVTESGSPVAGQLVTFTVTGQNDGASGTCAPADCKTDSSGNVTFTYTDTKGAGTDTILASFTDTNGSTQQASASETWTAKANTAPVANDQSVSTPQDTAVGVTLGATDADGDALTYAIVTGPSHGTLTGTGANRTYTPDAGYTGPDSFTFKANDGTADSNTATVSITVTKVNHAPVAKDASVTTPQDTAVGVTLDATDADGDALTYAIVTGPSHGTLTGTGANRTYTPDTGYYGPDSFTFKANDGSADSNTATVSITVTKADTCATTAPSVDATVSADQKFASRTVKAPAFSTAGDGELLTAFVSADGPASPTQTVTGVTGGGLTWTMASRSNSTWGTTEVWQAYAPSKLTGVSVVATLAKSYDASITVAAFQGAGTHVGSTAVGAGTSGAPSATLTPTGCNSLVWATGHDWSNSANPVAATGQTIVHKFLDLRVHDSFWTQKVDDPTTFDRAPVTVADTAPTRDRWTLAAVEIPGV